MNFTFPIEWWEDKGDYYLNKAVQGSDEWKQFRKYRLTASNFGTAAGKSKFSTPLSLAQESCNIICKEFDQISLDNMSHGTKTEPLARDWYCEEKGVKVIEVGLAVPKWNHYIGASLDGDVFKISDTGELIPTAGIIEIKSPKKMYVPLKQHSEKSQEEIKMIKKVYPYYHDHIYPTHYAQMQGAMKITNKKWCDYIVYATESNLVFCERVPFNKKYWENDLYPKIEDYLNNIMIPLIK